MTLALAAMDIYAGENSYMPLKTAQNTRGFVYDVENLRD